MSTTTLRATRKRAPDEPCLNCGNTTPGEYCPACGQRKTEVLVSVRTLIASVLEDQLVLNPALPRTLVGLLFRPGWLTSEYVSGRIVRYIAPFRLYLFSSITFFLILSFVGLARLDNVNLGVAENSGLNLSVATSGSETDTTAIPDEADPSAAEPRATEPSVTEPSVSEPVAAEPRVAEPGATEQTVVPSPAESRAAEPSPAEPGAASPRTPADSAALTVQQALQQAARAAAQEGDSAAAAAIQRVANGEMQEWAREFMSDTTVDGLFQHAIRRKVAQYGHLEGRAAGVAILRDLLEYAPHMVFLMLPLYALLLKLLYIRRDRYYAEHFVFALHVHAFFFIMFTLIFLLPTMLDIVLILWMIAYVWLAMKRVYEQGWLRTTLKWWTLGWCYSFIVSFGLVGLAIATLLLT